MNIYDLREAQARYETQINKITKDRLPLYKIRNSFTKYFTGKRILSMELKDYVIGVGSPAKGFNFCYTLERDLDGLGRIIGSTAFKFGVYYGHIKSDESVKYRFTNKFGNTLQETFSGIKQSIIELLVAGEEENLQLIEKNKISPMFKGKILCTYFPDRYLNVFSDDHLNYFLKQLGLDREELIKSDSVYKREALIEFKNRDSVMQNWSTDLFSNFLYQEYPGRPPKDWQNEDVSKSLDKYRTPDFPLNPEPSFITLNILPPIISNNTQPTLPQSRNKKLDYEEESRKWKKYGDRGEEIVLRLEEARWNQIKGHSTKKVIRVSLESDSYGYDILSYNDDGTERYIEVKATNSRVGSANFFLTANELKTASEKENYYIYMVYDIMSDSPKVWRIENPFKSENESVVKKPVKYRVTINAGY